MIDDAFMCWLLSLKIVFSAEILSGDLVVILNGVGEKFLASALFPTE
jgi:hypothetical protein